MASALSLLLSTLLIGSSAVKAQSSDVFSYVQPLNTTILGQYGHSPAVYPSPNATGAGGWEAALAKATAFVAQLTLEEKSDMVTGTAGPCIGNIVAIPRLGFPGLCLQDGPLAIRNADYASVFSAGVSAAATFNKSLMYERGNAMGQEFKAKGAHIFLGPVAGPLGRAAYGGRNWEGFSSDPYLTGIGMEETINGMQDAGVQATAKHWIGNEQEVMRNPSYEDDAGWSEVIQEAVSSNVDDRTIHELYMWPFANAVKANAASFMCSYQRLNGSYGCQNSKSLNGLLKGELGFQGYVMSDWGATHSGVASIESGMDMTMPGGFGKYGQAWTQGSFFGGNVTAAVNNGTVDVSRVDDMIVRIMTPYYYLGQDVDFPTVDPSSADLNTFSLPNTYIREFNITGERSRDVRGDHGEIIRRHGAAAAVLLKNVNNALPLKAPKSIGVFGNDASDDTQGYYNQNDFEYGTLSVGGGSGTGRLSYLVTPLEAIKARAKQSNALVQAWLNNTLIISGDATNNWVPTPPEVCLVFLKTWAQEDADRQHLSVDWNGDDMVEAVAQNCSNTVVVTHSSGINMLPWADHPNVTAIIAAHYPGEQTGNSIVDILYGDVNPSARLPYTIAMQGSDYNAPPTTAIQTDGVEDWQSWFDEKLAIDYRYFDAHNITVRYEFGFGLSYTTFSMANIAAEALDTAITSAAPEQAVQPGGSPALWEGLYNVTVDITNTGDLDGAAVPQLYVTLPSTAPEGTPLRQLRGFDNVFLTAGETKTVSFELMRRDLSYWDTVSQQWLIPTGEFTLSLGWSSRDLQVFQTITPVSA